MAKRKKFEDGEVVRAINLHLMESKQVKYDRTTQNAKNWEIYNFIQDYSDKREGQSCEFLPKLFVATERSVSVMKRALVNFDRWIEVETTLEGAQDPVFDKETLRKILTFYLENADVKTKMTDGLKNGMLESLVTIKVHGGFDKKLEFEAVELDPDEELLRRISDEPPQMDPNKRVRRVERDIWRLKLDVVGSEDYFPDPRGQGLFDIQITEKDLFQIQMLAEGDNAIYKKGVVDLISQAYQKEEEERLERAKQGLEYDNFQTKRRMVKLTEFCGTLLTSTGEVIHENCICTVANDAWLIRGPEDNPFWHNESPYVCAPLIRVPGTVWHKAVMDAPAYLNQSLNDIFNLMLDGGMNAAMNAVEVNSAWLEDPSQVSNGIHPGDAIRTNTRKPPGVPAIQPIKAGDVPSEALNIFNLLETEFQAAAFSNDVLMGQTPGKTTTATAVAQASASTSALFDSIAKDFEDVFIEPMLQKAHMVIWQNIRRIDDEELVALIGRAKADEINAIDPAERFSRVANMARFRAKGLSATLNRFRDVARFTQIVQMISSSPDLMAEFKKNHSFERLLAEFLMSIGMDESKIALNEQEKQQQAAEQQRQQQAAMQMAALQAQAAQGQRRKPGPKPQPDFDNMNQNANPEEVGGGAQQVNAELGGLR